MIFFYLFKVKFIYDTKDVVVFFDRYINKIFIKYYEEIKSDKLNYKEKYIWKFSTN